MSRASTPDHGSPSPPTSATLETPARLGLLALVTIGLAIQLVFAAAAVLGPRPGHYGWQMYSAVPYVPDVTAVAGQGERSLDFGALVVHPRAEIDYVGVARAHGCEASGADELRIELADGRIETVTCP